MDMKLKYHNDYKQKSQSHEVIAEIHDYVDLAEDGACIVSISFDTYGYTKENAISNFYKNKKSLIEYLNNLILELEKPVDDIEETSKYNFI